MMARPLQFTVARTLSVKGLVMVLAVVVALVAVVVAVGVLQTGDTRNADAVGDFPRPVGR